MAETSELPDSVHDGLRGWAKGVYPLEAATELLIRSGFADPSLPWVFRCDTDSDPERAHWHGIDFERIPELLGGMSGGERRFLLIAASIGSGSVEVNLHESFSGLDRDRVDLILAALAHAAGTHEGRLVVVDGDAGTLSFGEAYESLHPWPGTKTAVPDNRY